MVIVLGTLIKIGLPLMKYRLTTLAKSVLMPLVLTTEMLATEASIQKKIFVSGITTLIISRKMKDITKIVKNLSWLALRIWFIVKVLKMKQKNNKLDFLAFY